MLFSWSGIDSYLFMFYFELDMIISRAESISLPMTYALASMVTPRKKLINTNTEVKVNFPLNDSAGGSDDSCQAIVHDSELEHEKLMICLQQN